MNDSVFHTVLLKGWNKLIFDTQINQIILHSTGWISLLKFIAILWTLCSLLCTDQYDQITSADFAWIVFGWFCRSWHFWKNISGIFGKNQLILSCPADLYTTMIKGFIRLFCLTVLAYFFWLLPAKHQLGSEKFKSFGQANEHPPFWH